MKHIAKKTDTAEIKRDMKERFAETNDKVDNAKNEVIDKMNKIAIWLLCAVAAVPVSIITMSILIVMTLKEIIEKN